MKKIFIPAVFLVFLSSAVFAQKLKASKVPAVVKASFAKEYPGTVAKWEKENGKYEVSFTKHGNRMSLTIEPNGSITETEMNIKVIELPADVMAYVKKHYPGMNIKEAAKITKADRTINYETEVNGKDLVFDANGKFIRETKD